MKAFIDKSGCGLCAEVCPDVFRMADDGLAEVYTDPTNETIDAANEAARSCPVEVITIEK